MTRTQLGAASVVPKATWDPFARPSLCLSRCCLDPSCLASFCLDDASCLDDYFSFATHPEPQRIPTADPLKLFAQSWISTVWNDQKTADSHVLQERGRILPGFPWILLRTFEMSIQYYIFGAFIWHTNCGLTCYILIQRPDQLRVQSGPPLNFDRWNPKSEAPTNFVNPKSKPSINITML